MTIKKLVLLTVFVVPFVIYLLGSSNSTGAILSYLSGSADSFVQSIGTKSKDLYPATSKADLQQQQERDRQESIKLWSFRYTRAQDLYNQYRDTSRYPFESRPISDAPDQIYPFEPIFQEALSENGRGAEGEGEGIIVKFGQDRVFLSGKDSVKFTVQVFDKKTGNKIPTASIISASAQSVPEGTSATRPRIVSLSFSDSGPAATGGIDEVPSDGKFTARLSPDADGYGDFKGMIRSEVIVKGGGHEAKAVIDITYIETVPASWGAIRETQELGSLNFYLKANVKVAGRYMVSTRVDDANGKPFAILYFQDELAIGQQELKLNLFGALIHDKRPVFPLKLRDVSGYVLIPDTFPDRMMMPQREGVVHTSRTYPFENFSSGEWQSEQRTRYLDEFGRDIDIARSELALLGVR